MIRTGRRRLGLLLTLYAFLSLMLAAAVFLGGRWLGERVVNDVVYTKQNILKHEAGVYTELCAYIRKEGIQDAADNEKLRAWFKDRDHLIAFIYDYYKQSSGARSSVGSFLSSSDEDTIVYSSVSEPMSTYAVLQSQYEGYWFHGPLEIRGANDFPMVVRIIYFPMYTASIFVLVLSAVLAFMAFALCLTLLFRRKTGYISKLSSELNAMAAGELNVPMTVKGNDELTTLAENMDEMRLSFIKRLEKEEQMNKNASRLLTDMSHDLRTPLTALIGYLEILDGGKAGSEEQRAKYVLSAKNRAYQIKNMTDELFEYFLVYSYDAEKIEKQTCDALTLISQLWDEASFGLESEGFRVETVMGDISAQVEANPNLLRRVFDNVVSNIIKYADRSEPVRCVSALENNVLTVSVSNLSLEAPKSTDSSHIGLSSCKKIAELHGGSFETELVASGENDPRSVFVCRFSLPVLTKQ